MRRRLLWFVEEKPSVCFLGKAVMPFCIRSCWGIYIHTLHYFTLYFFIKSKWQLQYLVLFVVGAAPPPHLNVKRGSREFFQRIFGVCSRSLQDKNVYEPNFANVVVISTLIFCSLCLVIFTLFLFLLLGGDRIRIDVFLVVKHLFKTSAAIR